MSYITDRSVKQKARIKPFKTGVIITERFTGPAVAENVADTGSLTLLGETGLASGTLSLTAGQFDQDYNDVPRDVNLLVHTATGDVLTGGTATIAYMWNGKQRTKKVTFGGQSDETATAYPLGVGLNSFVTADFEAVGATLTGLLVGFGYGEQLAVRNETAGHSFIIREQGIAPASTPTLSGGLFTPATTLNGTNDVEVDVAIGG